MALNNTLIQSLQDGDTPVILLQLSISQPWNDFIVDSAGIWKFRTLNNTYTGIDTEITENFPTLIVVGISDVKVGGISLPEITSYTDTIDGRASALSAQPSFIFDGTNDILYCRFNTNYDPPLGLDIDIGAIFALSDKAYYDNVNNINYVPDLKNTPNFNQRKDPIFFEQLRFDAFTQNINNSDYRYDDKRDANIFGSLAEYYLGTTALAFSNFDKIFTGRAGKYAFNRDTWTLAIRDSRKALNNKIPINFISDTTYPNADDYASSTPLPLLYGVVIDVPCISLDENDTSPPANYRFAFADTNDFTVNVTSTQVKVDGNPVTPSVAPNGTTGLFSLSSSDYTPGQTVTYSGGGIIDGTTVLNQLDIAKHLLVNYANIPYTTANFNTTEWASETTKAKDMGIAIYQTTSVIKAIQLLAQSSAAGFLRQPDGLFTWRTFDSTSDPIIQVRNDDYLDDPRLEGDIEEVLATATVKYDKSYSSGRWKRQTDSSEENQVNGDFGIFTNKEFDTQHITSANALSFAQDIMSRSQTVREIIELAVPSWFAQAEIGQNIEIELDHTDDTSWIGILKCEVLEFLPDIGNGRVRYKIRVFEELDNFTEVGPDTGLLTEAGEFYLTQSENYLVQEE